MDYCAQLVKKGKRINERHELSFFKLRVKVGPEIEHKP